MDNQQYKNPPNKVEYEDDNDRAPFYYPRTSTPMPTSFRNIVADIKIWESPYDDFVKCLHGPPKNVKLLGTMEFIPDILAGHIVPTPVPIALNHKDDYLKKKILQFFNNRFSWTSKFVQYFKSPQLIQKGVTRRAVGCDCGECLEECYVYKGKTTDNYVANICSSKKCSAVPAYCEDCFYLLY